MMSIVHILCEVNKKFTQQNIQIILMLQFQRTLDDTKEVTSRAFFFLIIVSSLL